MAAIAEQGVPIAELNAGDRIEWAKSDKGQGKFWRTVAVRSARPDERFNRRWTIVVENDAGVREARLQAEAAVFVRVATAEGRAIA